MALAVVLALLAGISAGPAASAQQASPPPAPDPGTAIPEVFRPGPINRTPPPSQAPPEGLELLAGATPAPEPARELIERRTEDSRTFEAEDGVVQTVVYGGPVNYQDANGNWQPIDTALVPADAPDFAFRSAAGPVSVELPAVLGAHPVRMSFEHSSVAFTLQGASATPTLGPPADILAPTPTPEIAKASATYVGALPGVDVVYAAGAEGVKEELVLAGPDATASFDFTVALSEGLSAQETPEGGIALVDTQGLTKAAVSAPFAYDQNYVATGDEQGYSTEAVSLRIVEHEPELVVRLAADPAWLADPARAFPVVIDPTISLKGSNSDTTLRKAAPDANYGSNEILGLKGGSDTHRILFRQGVGTGPLTVLAAEVQLYALDDTSTKTPRKVSVHEVSAGWESGQATWRQRTTGVNWATPGGDIRSPALVEIDKVNGPAGYRAFPITSAMQAWKDGERPDNGVLIKYADEAAGDPIAFGSVNQFFSDYRPRFVYNAVALAGVRDPYQHLELDLGPKRQGYVHLVSGNLTLEEPDLAIAGTGLDATVTRYYQSHPGHRGSVGARWRMWPQSEERLYYATHGLAGIKGNNGDVKWQGGPNELVVFSRRPDGTYTSPHGYRATLELVPEGTSQVFRLSFHETGVVYRFYSSGYVRDITDRNGNRLTFGYTCDTVADECFMVSMTDTQGRVTTFERIGEHQVSVVTDAAGRTHRYGYGADASGNPLLTSYTDPTGAVTTYGYTGNVLNRVTDPNGNVTTMTYESGRLKSITRVSGTGVDSTWTFDFSVNDQTKVTDPRGNATVHHLDARGRVTKVVDALGHVRQGSYDSNSNVIDRTSATGAKSIATFDPATSNLLSSQLPTGAKSTLEYTDTRHKYFPTKLTNSQGNASSLAYDTPGNVVSATDSMPTAGVTRFTYNPNGTMASSTDAKGATTTYGYDAKGNLTQVSPPAPLGATTVVYDGLSRVTATTDGKGQTTTYAYDALDRPTRIGFADGLVVTLAYDAGGRLTTRTDATGTTTYAYDRLNRVAEERLPGGRVNTYTYDVTGNLISMTDATGTVTYGYNAVNLATSVVEPGGAKTTFAYDDDDNRTSTVYPNGVAQSATYDPSSRLKTIEGKRGTTVLTRFAYDYARSGADTGLRHSVIDKNNRTTTYAYDALDRLLQAKTTTSSGSVVDDFRYGYDAVGNRTSETVRESTLLGTRDVTTTATFNAADQLTSRGNVTYSYDANGNQTGSSAGQALAYNAADQTISLKRAGGTALAAAYAGSNQFERASAGATTFTNTLLGLSVGADTKTTAYTRDPAGGLVGMRTPSSYYYLFDGLGSVVAVTNSSGSVTNSYTYDPYGVTTETKAALTNVFNPWRYAGQYQDVSTGLYKMGARYYEPELGRWTQPDPSGQDANAYLYVGGNPVNLIDPSGLGFLGVDCPFGETDSGGCNGASREAIGTGLSVAGTAAGIAAVPFTGGTSLALSAASVGLGTAGGAVQCGAEGAAAAAGIGVLGGGVAGAFMEGGAKAAGIAVSVGGEAASYATC